MALVGLGVASGCNDLDRFETEADEAYCGKIVAADFVRQGFADDLGLRLTLVIAELETRPGILSSGDSASGPCEPAPLFDEAPLRAIEKLLSDPLSTLDFGSGRVHNFFAWVDSTCSGPMLAVVSLLSNGTVEVRLFRPGLLTAEGADESGFGIFPLVRGPLEDCAL